MLTIDLVTFKNGFDSAAGSGLKRYAFELTRNILSDNKNYLVQKTEIKPFLNNETALGNFLGAYDFMLTNNSKADIMHFLTHNPAINGQILKNSTNATIFATAIEFGYISDPVLADIGVAEFVKNNYDIKDMLHWQLLKKNLYGSLGADYLIAISSQTKDEAVSLGFNKNKIFVVNLGVDERFRMSSHKKSKNLFKVGYIGSLRPRKNVQFSIKAFKELSDINIIFEIWGNKVAGYDLLQKISNNDKHIHFMGFAPEDNIVKIYDSFDVYLHPTLYTGFELEILEAQSRGIPVIIYKDGKVPSEVRKYCFEAEDPVHMAQIIQELKENGYNEKTKKKATEYARSFTWEKTAKETLEIYNKLI